MPDAWVPVMDAFKQELHHVCAPQLTYFLRILVHSAQWGFCFSEKGLPHVAPFLGQPAKANHEGEKKDQPAFNGN